MNKNKNIGRYATYIIMVFACGAALISIRCKDNCVGQPPVIQPAFVRFINASPDSPPVDMIVDSVTVVTGLAFNSYPTSTEGYHSVRPTVGATLTVRFSGTTTTSATAPVSFSPGNYYTVVLLNKKNSQQLLVLGDTLTTPSTDSARVRFIHAVLDLTSINVTIAGKPAVTGLSFGHSSGYITMHTLLPSPLGSDTGSLDVTEGTAPYSQVFEIPSGKVVLVGQSVFTIIILGDFNPTGTEPLPTASIFLDNSPSANGLLISYDFAAVRMLNLVYNQTPIGLDIYNAVKTPNFNPNWRADFPNQGPLDFVKYDSISPYLVIDFSEFKQDNNSQYYWMGIRGRQPYTNAIVADSTAIYPFIKDHRYTAAVVGTDAGPDSFVILQDTLAGPPPGMATVRFFNGSPDPTATSSLSIEGGQSLYNGIGFKQVTQSTFVPSGAITFVLSSSNGSTRNVPAQLSDGGTYTLVASGLTQDSSYTLKIYEK